MPEQTDPDLLAGHGGFEDAGVYRLTDELALVQTVDFFPPIVDDPRWFGRIAAANSLSDVYAMGGRPCTAMNIVGWPKDLDVAILGEVLAGGMDKVMEAGAVLVGGHSVTDSEIKYGLSVTGLVHPDRFWRNLGALEGDVLLLTKPLGMGPLSTAIKKEKVSPAQVTAAMEQMATLNKAAAEALADLPVSACTDVTGFGLMGHGAEMASGSKGDLALELWAEALPLAAGSLDLAREGIVSGGSKRGRENLGARALVDSDVDEGIGKLVFDAETSGGLMVALPETQLETGLARLRNAGAPAAEWIGRFRAREDGGPVVHLKAKR